MVHDVKGRSVLHLPEQGNQAEYVDCERKISRSRILNLHHHGIQGGNLFGFEGYVGGAGNGLFAGQEDGGQVAPAAEKIVKVFTGTGIPAGGRAEHAYLPLEKGLVELVGDWSGAERKH